MGDRALVCRVGWHSLRADHRRRVDYCTRCGREWKLYVVPIPRWLAKLLRPWR